MLIDSIKDILSRTELKPRFTSEYRNIEEGILGHNELKGHNRVAVDNWNISNPFFKEFVSYQYVKSGAEIDRFSIDPDMIYSFENESFSLRNDFVLLDLNNNAISPFNDDGFSFYTLLNSSVQYIGDVHVLQEVLSKHQIDNRENKVVETSKRRYQKFGKKPEVKSEVKSDTNGAKHK